jgi:hypothetical protein
MTRRILLGILLLAMTALWASVTITWDQWPYGPRYIGGYTKWWMNNTSGSPHVTVPSFSSDDSIWDLVGLGGSATNRNAESDIRPKGEAQGSPPSIATYAEKQIFNGQTSWGYEGMDTTGGTQYMWLYGIYTQGTQVDYDPPYNQVYQFPMQLGNSWSNEWTWNYMGMDLVTETRNNYIVAEGRVRVPGDTLNWYPCLVIRTYSTSVDELGAINESRIIHEWVVPDMGRVGGSVATIQSQNQETDPGFTDAAAVFKQKEFHSVFDNSPPTFVNTTVIPSGYNLGPFHVASRITDPNSVVKDSLYYKVGNQAWQAAGRDSMRNSTYHFHIPLLAGSDTVRYYLAASDTAPSRNRGTEPTGAPAAHYRFYARDPAEDMFPPEITGTTQLNDTAFTGPFVISANVTDSCAVDSVVLLYRVNSGVEQPVAWDSVRGSLYCFTIPSAGMNTFIRYKIRAVDGSPNHNFGFDPASGYYSFNVIDAEGPGFANTTEWPDTIWPGPFLIQSQVTDVSGVQWGRIFFKLGSANWDSLPSDSSAGDLWSFHVPLVTSPMSIRYYLKAADNSQRHNMASDPANAPSTYYSFFCDPHPGIEGQEGLARLWNLRLGTVNPRWVELTLPADGELRIGLFDAKGSLVRMLAAGAHEARNWKFSLPGNLASGSYLLEIQVRSERLIRHFAVAR